MRLDFFFTASFAPIVGMAFLLIFLCFNARLVKEIKRLFFLLLAFEAAELIVYDIELLFAARPYFSQWRILLSAVGYTVRPILSFLVLLLTLRRKLTKAERALLPIPIILNALIAFSAFWTDIAYAYTESNVFIRGPLGYSSQICVSVYLLLLVRVTFSQLRTRNKLESLIMVATTSLIIGSMVAEAIWLIRSIGRTAIVLSTVFYYMFFQTQEYQETLAEEERIHERLEQQAKTDQATGLLNKTAFMQLFAQALTNRRGASVALIFLDLDRFKRLNDKLGHRTGDLALRDVADVLRRTFQSADMLGRFGGDEFCALTQGLSEEQLARKLDEVSGALRREYAQGKESVQVTASIGAVLIKPDETADPARVLESADIAAYSVKNAGGNGYVIVGKEYERSVNSVRIKRRA